MSQHLHSDFKIRLPDELKEKIRHSANELNRSMTADIVARLEASFNTSGNEGLVSTLDEHLSFMAEQNNMLMNEVKLLRNHIMSDSKKSHENP